MHMVTHDAQGIKLETKFGLTVLARRQQNLFDFKPSQPEFAIITTRRDVVAIVGF